MTVSFQVIFFISVDFYKFMGFLFQAPDRHHLYPPPPPLPLKEMTGFLVVKSNSANWHLLIPNISHKFDGHNLHFKDKFQKRNFIFSINLPKFFLQFLYPKTWAINIPSIPLKFSAKFSSVKSP